jgi:hypothetical protein
LEALEQEQVVVAAMVLAELQVMVVVEFQVVGAAVVPLEALVAMEATV